jgi:hypothetical protein
MRAAEGGRFAILPLVQFALIVVERPNVCADPLTRSRRAIPLTPWIVPVETT